MARSRGKNILIATLITGAISLTICHFIFERWGEYLFYSFLLTLFLLAQVSIFAGARSSMRLNKELRRTDKDSIMAKYKEYLEKEEKEKNKTNN